MDAVIFLLFCVLQFNTSSKPWLSMSITSILPSECKKMHLLVSLEAEPGSIVFCLKTVSFSQETLVYLLKFCLNNTSAKTAVNLFQ